MLIIQYLLLPELLKQVTAGLQAVEDGVRVGLDHEQLGVVTRGAGAVIWPGQRHGLYHLGEALLLVIHGVQSVLDRAHGVHRCERERGGTDVGEVGP